LLDLLEKVRAEMKAFVESRQEPEL
jgi:hypothetical protein